MGVITVGTYVLVRCCWLIHLLKHADMDAMEVMAAMLLLSIKVLLRVRVFAFVQEPAHQRAQARGHGCYGGHGG